MSVYLGIDTSNYTTSAAALDNGALCMKKLLLPVKHGEKGLRQSDAVFHHVRQLPDVCEGLIKGKSFDAIGVSFAPRRAEGSYMPCFNVGVGLARVISEMLGAPLYLFSHQEGHIAAALYSAGRLDLLGEAFLAFHVSGGTTDALLVSPEGQNPLGCTLLGTSLDLHAGQAVDRVGVMLGLDFPCGGELEKLALRYDGKISIKPCVKGYDICLSGIENICRKMMSQCEPREKIAACCIEYIAASLDTVTERLTREYSGLPVIYSGGVMRNSIIKSRLKSKYNAYFAEPEFSSDNAAGVAVFAEYAHENNLNI